MANAIFMSLSGPWAEIKIMLLFVKRSGHPVMIQVESQESTGVGRRPADKAVPILTRSILRQSQNQTSFQLGDFSKVEGRQKLAVRLGP
jgi:hypothetical protein